MKSPHRSFLLPCLLAVATILSPLLGRAQLFENLQALSNRIKVGDSLAAPKGLIAADLDGDGKADWAVSRLDGKLEVAFGQGNGKFEALLEIPSPAGALRQLIAADLNGDGRLDLASADP